MSQQTTVQCSGATFISFSNKSTNYSSLSSIPTCWAFGWAHDYNIRQTLNQKSGTLDFGGAVFDFNPGNGFRNKKINSVTLHYTVDSANQSKLKVQDYFCEEILTAYTNTTPINELNYYSYFEGGSGYTYTTELVEYLDNSMSSLNRSVEISDFNTKSNLLLGQVLRVVIAVGANQHDASSYIIDTYPDNVSARYYNGNYAFRQIAKSSVYIVVDWDYIKPAVTALAPYRTNIFVENEPITFSWQYFSDASSPQASATIEYKLTGASTWTTITSSGTGTTYTLSAGLSAGTYEWRIKVTDEQGETSNYDGNLNFTVAEQPAQTPTYPVDTGLPAYAPIAFSWTFNKPSSASAATQASATLQYRARGSGIWIDQAVTGSSTTWTLAAGLSVGQYEWRVCVTNNYGNTSSYCNIKYFQIVAQSVPTPLEPGDNITLFEGHDVTFKWLYNSLTPATQASATIKYRVVGGSTWMTYTSASSNPFCSISEIPQGQYEWCLNVTNNYGETSADSGTLEFNIIGRPQRPIITTPANCCLTTISWNASGQEAAEFILMQGDDILIHETVATAVTSYKPQMFLKGTYKAMARIKNNSDLWSDYGELEFTIDAAAPDAGTLIAMPFDTEIKLEGTYTSSNAAIVRIDEDGTENVISMTAAAIDKKIAGTLEYAYVLRCWDTGGSVDTPLKVFTFNFEGSIFTTDIEELHLDRSEQKFLAHDEELGRQYATMRYVGREFPVIERGEYTEQTLTKQFHVTKAQRRILDRMAKEKSLFYRDSRGNAFKAAILNVSYSNYMDNDYIASIRLTRTAADEVIINV